MQVGNERYELVNGFHAAENQKYLRQRGELPRLANV
jgi:hypothetical protein